MGCLHAFHIGNLCKPGRRKHAIVVGRLPEVGEPRLPAAGNRRSQRYLVFLTNKIKSEIEI